MTEEILRQAISFASDGDKGTAIDRENRIIVYVFAKGVTEQGLMAEGMLGDWYVKNGFNVEFEVRDVAYTTHARTRQGYRFGALGSCVDPHTAYLRNRTVMTITW